MLTKIKKYIADYYVKVMQIPDSPTKIAQGLALGTALNFLPIPLVSIPISYVLARILKINAVASVLATVFTKWAVPFFYTFNVLVGNLIVQGDITQISLPEFSYDTLVIIVRELSCPFFIGCAINFTVSSALVYFIFLNVLASRQGKLNGHGRRE